MVPMPSKQEIYAREMSTWADWIAQCINTHKHVDTTLYNEMLNWIFYDISWMHNLDSSKIDACIHIL
jgi:hypothetical protein